MPNKHQVQQECISTWWRQFTSPKLSKAACQRKMHTAKGVSACELSKLPFTTGRCLRSDRAGTMHMSVPSPWLICTSHTFFTAGVRHCQELLWLCAEQLYHVACCQSSSTSLILVMWLQRLVSNWGQQGLSITSHHITLQEWPCDQRQD